MIGRNARSGASRLSAALVAACCMIALGLTNVYPAPAAPTPARSSMRLMQARLQPTLSARAPAVTQPGNGARWRQFSPHTLGAGYNAIVTGPDHNLYFLDMTGVGLVRMSENGSTVELSLSHYAKGTLTSMIVGADGLLYIADESAQIIRVSLGGGVSVVPTPSGDHLTYGNLAVGPDKNVYFTEFDHIGRITPAGKIAEVAYPAGYNGNDYGGITAGADGNMWFADTAIGRLVLANGKITMFSIPGPCIPAPVVLGKDKNVWFACLTTSPKLGKITPTGAITTYPVGGTFSFSETGQFCAPGPDGEPWCASGNDGTLFRINTAAGTVTTFPAPLPSGARPSSLTTGPDGNIWMDTAGANGTIDVLIADPMTVTPSSLTFTAAGQTKSVTISQSATTSWSVASSDTHVATVAATGSSATYNVTAIAAGSCRVTVSDSRGNSVAVNVTVK